MGTKSIRHIVEATLATYLSTQTYKPGSAWITLVVIDDNQ